MSYPEKHSFCFSETREFILNGLVVPPLKIVEFLETGRIQMQNLEKERDELREFKENWIELKTQLAFSVENYEEYEVDIYMQILKEMKKLEEKSK